MDKTKKSKKITYLKSILFVSGFVIIIFVLFAFFNGFNFWKADHPEQELYDDQDFKEKREQMVVKLAQRDDVDQENVTDPGVLEAMGTVKRHFFVDAQFRDSAYRDVSLPIAEGQNISQPYVVARMTELLEIEPGERVLEIGTGSGYQAAVLAELSDEVYSIEIREGLVDIARANLKNAGYKDVKVKHADGYFGWEEYAPFDAIIVTCAANHIPPSLIEQLGEGGRLVIPLGETEYFQMLTKIVKEDDEKKLVSHTGPVCFVPMVGEADFEN